MVNEEKVKLMTKIQIFHDNETEAIKANKFYGSDYVWLYMIRSLIAYVILYCMGIGMILLYRYEEILTTFDLNLFINYAKWLGGSFLILAIPAMVLSYIIYWFRYRKNRKKIREYEHNLKRLNAIYRVESNNETTRKAE